MKVELEGVKTTLYETRRRGWLGANAFRRQLRDRARKRRNLPFMKQRRAARTLVASVEVVVRMPAEIYSVFLAEGMIEQSIMPLRIGNKSLDSRVRVAEALL